MTARDVVAAGSGLLFALGLGVAGMTNPHNVLGFLDVGGAWDPSLALVMGGAIAVHFWIARRAARGARPLLASQNALPEGSVISARRLAGAAIFGVGWGVAGVCPGPALVSAASLALPPLVFVAAMIAGMRVHRRYFDDPGCSPDRLSEPSPAP